jgi:DNA-binding transcriptional MerR regulator
VGRERKGKVKKAKRDEKGWRIYDNDDIEKLMALRIVESFL